VPRELFEIWDVGEETPLLDASAEDETKLIN
jgi:hypothetical protein